MTNINTTRVLTFILLVAFAASASFAQGNPTSAGGAGNEAATPAPVTTDAVSESAPNPPKVTCESDQLTISASNSTLESVLTAVHSCTGVKIDVPEGIADSRVFDQLGPGPAREILTSLLEAMNINYVIGSSDATPDKVDSVLLIARAGDAPTVGGNPDRSPSANRRAWMQTRQNRAASAPEEPTIGTTDTTVTAPVEEPAAAAAENPAISPGPVAADPTPARTDHPTPTPIEGKTTSDQITSMQQLFEQRRQMMEKQNAGKP